MNAFRSFVVLIVVLATGTTRAEDWTAAYDNPPWKVLRSTDSQAPLCLAAAAQTEGPATLMIVGGRRSAAIILQSPTWSFEKSVGKSSLVTTKAGGYVPIPNSDYIDQAVYVWTGTDPAMAYMLMRSILTGKPGPRLIFKGATDEELASFQMDGFGGWLDAFKACVDAL